MAQVISTLRSISPLLTASAFLLLGVGMLNTTVGVRLSAAGFGAGTAGFVMGAYFFGLVLGTFYANKTIARIGHIRAYAALASVLSAATLTHPFLVSPWLWGGLRLIEGMCLAGLYMCIESWLNERASDENRGEVLSYYQITTYLSLGVGQFLITIPDPTSFGLFVITSILLSLTLVPVAMTRMIAPTPPEPVQLNFGRIYRRSPLGMIGTFMSGVMLGGFYALGPHYTRELGLDIGDTATFMGVAILGGLVLQWPLGKLSDLINRRIVILSVAGGGVAISLIVAAASSGTFAGLLVAVMLFGGLVAALYPLAVSHANDRIEPQDLVPMSAGLLIAYGVGAAVGPIGASAFMEVYGANGLFYFAASAAGATVAFAFWRTMQRAAPTVEDQGDFQILPRTTPMAAEMDPRGEESEAGEESDLIAADPETAA